MGRRERRKLLERAVDEGDLDAVRALEAEDPGLVARGNSHGNTPLMGATSSGDLAMVTLLVELGADVNARNDGGWAVIDNAGGAARRVVAEYLIAQGAEADAWHFAAMGDRARLEAALDDDPALLTEGRRRRGDTILHVAVHAGQVEIVELLLARGADVAAENHNDHAALAAVAPGRTNRLEMARVLLAAGADPNAHAGHYDGTVLHEAIGAADLELARLLLEAGADPSRQDYGGNSALHKAVGRGRKDLVELVLAFSPDLDLRNREVPNTNRPGGETALDWAVRAGRKGVAEMIRRHAGA